MDYEEKRSVQRKSLMLAGGIILLLIVSVTAWTTLQRRGKIPIEIRKLPHDTKITVNGAVARGSTIYLKPGKYVVKGEYEGFEPYSRKIDVTPESEIPIKLFFALTPKSDEARKWVMEHTDEYLDFELVAGEAHNEKSQEVRDKYPIMKELPYRGDLYNIEYFLDGDKFKVQVKSPTALGRQVAIERIKSWGYEPADYEIEFLGLDNPFVVPERKADNE